MRGLKPNPPRDAMPQDPVLCAIEDGVAVVTLNNPPLNLVTLEMTRRAQRHRQRGSPTTPPCASWC